MKRINTQTTKRVAAIIIAAVAACSVMGCSVEKNFTSTTTHTVTDANGNTTTTTTTNNNGVVTTESYTTTADDMNTTAEETDTYEPQSFSQVPLVIENDMGWDIASLNLKMSTDDEWSDDFLGDNEYIDDGVVARGINVTYDEENRFIDIHVADSDGASIDFSGLELPTEVKEEIVLSFEYDEADGSYTVSVVG